MTEYRASFDAVIGFSNGGDLTAHRFRVDVSSADASPLARVRIFVVIGGL
jgi:arylformamidase